MTGESNLDVLLNTMARALRDKPYVFLTLQTLAPGEVDQAIMHFKEQEGIALITREDVAKTFDRTYAAAWAMITLTVHSDLQAVGLLAAITTKLAAANILVNAISAFFHDHLFVPWERRQKAMEILESFRK
jgi:hypothetical protein